MSIRNLSAHFYSQFLIYLVPTSQLDETQELLDDALEGMGEIKRRREELACAEYSPAVTLRASQPQKGIEEIQWKQKPSGCRQGSSSRPWDLDEDEVTCF